VFFWVVTVLFAVIGLVIWPVLGLVMLMLALRLKRPALALAGVIVVVVGMAFGAIKLRALTATIQLLPAFRGMPTQTECAGFRFGEPSLVFYSNHRWSFLPDATALSAWMTNSGPRFAVCMERETRLRKRTTDYSADLASLPTNGYQQTTIEGLDIARASWVRLRVYRRDGFGRAHDNGPPQQ
jgi:hypothetical protein